MAMVFIPEIGEGNDMGIPCFLFKKNNGFLQISIESNHMKPLIIISIPYWLHIPGILLSHDIFNHHFLLNKCIDSNKISQVFKIMFFFSVTKTPMAISGT